MRNAAVAAAAFPEAVGKSETGSWSDERFAL